MKDIKGNLAILQPGDHICWLPESRSLQFIRQGQTLFLFFESANDKLYLRGEAEFGALSHILASIIGCELKEIAIPNEKRVGREYELIPMSMD